MKLSLFFDVTAAVTVIAMPVAMVKRDDTTGLTNVEDAAGDAIKSLTVCALFPYH